MQLGWFLRRRSVLVPTLAGWAIVAFALLLAAALALRALPGYLAVDAPVGRGLLIVEGWLSDEALAAAAEAARSGRYDAVVVTGGPIHDATCRDGFASYAERAAAVLAALDLGGRPVFAVPAPDSERERTWASAVALRRWLDAGGRRVEAADVLSQGPHARRSRDLFRRALGDGVRVGVRAVPPADYELATWWRRSAGARDVLSEAIGYAWMVSRPGAPDP